MVTRQYSNSAKSPHTTVDLLHLHDLRQHSGGQHELVLWSRDKDDCWSLHNWPCFTTVFTHETPPQTMRVTWCNCCATVLTSTCGDQSVEECNLYSNSLSPGCSTCQRHRIIPYSWGRDPTARPPTWCPHCCRETQTRSSPTSSAVEPCPAHPMYIALCPTNPTHTTASSTPCCTQYHVQHIPYTQYHV